MTDLMTDEGLAAAALSAEDNYGAKDWVPGWRRELADFLAQVASLDAQQRAEEAFQRDLWDENPVSGVGQGTVDVSGAIADPGFRGWLSTRSLEPVPEGAGERQAHFEALYEDLLKRLEPHCPNRLPRLKVFRVLAALYPHDFTCLTHRTKAGELAKRLTGTSQGEVQRHLVIRQRLDAVLGRPDPGWDALAKRMTLPWFLYEASAEAPPEDRTTGDGIPERTPLIPLPAMRRRRSLTTVSGGLPFLVSCLELAKDGVSREDLRTHIKTENPRLKDSSLGTVIYTLQFEHGVLRRSGDTFFPTDRGLALLESNDPSELVDWLLTRVLGVDLVIAHLRDQGPTRRADLIALLKTANPGPKSEYGHNSTLTWLRNLGILAPAPDGRVQLTPEGAAWARLIHWTPECLPAEPTEEAPLGPGGTHLDDKDSELTKIRIPDEQPILTAIAAAGAFEPRLIAKLHAGLWAHGRRHFAILTGLSGTGKTLLALAYARALHPGDPQRQAANLQTVAVQPGWYDPSPLLGYVNPLRSENYVRTPFLDFLIRAADEPDRPFVAVLDEMNLSHPEQYLAPLLSAMESGAPIDLHREDDMLDGVPASLPYPTNLALIGTVNMDETTHGLSDKVLDRAFTIEFWDIDLNAYPRWGARPLDNGTEAAARALLDALLTALRPARLHFGWRVVDDVLDFLQRTQVSALITSTEALDDIVYGKILPKLRGDDSPRFQQALADCQEVLIQHGLQTSAGKVETLLLDLRLTGTARFWR